MTSLALVPRLSLCTGIATRVLAEPKPDRVGYRFVIVLTSPSGAEIDVETCNGSLFDLIVAQAILERWTVAVTAQGWEFSSSERIV